MTTMSLSRETLRIAAFNTAEMLRNGGVVLFPTDTLYGLGADALSNQAVDSIYRIKGRDEGKPIHALVSDIDMAARFGEISDVVRAFVEKLPKGKVTFICRKKIGVDTGIARGIDTFGFRIPDSPFCIAMLEAFGGPTTATSANRAGETPLPAVPAILEQLGDAASQLECIVDGGELPPSAPSTVIDMSGSSPMILREGAVSKALVAEVLSTL